MPLFEVDATRPLLVQGSGGTSGGEPGVHTSAHRVVESHIDGLLGEQVFPVAQGSSPHEPHLLALDASGSPVVVELVGDLDKSTLTRALDHAGAAGRLTRGELASRYHGGQQAFAHDVADFYDSVPITQSNTSKSGGGARLIIICQNAPQEILNAVDFLRQPTMPVEVLKMDVVKSDDGRRFLDVSPLVIHLPPGLPSPRQEDRRSITRGNEPDHVTPEPVASAPMFTTSRGTAPDPESFAEGVKVGYALTGKLPVVAHEPGRSGGTAPASPAPARSAAVPPPSDPVMTVPPVSGPTTAAAPSEQNGARPSAPAQAGRGTNPAKGLRRTLARNGGEATPARAAATAGAPEQPEADRPLAPEPAASRSPGEAGAGRDGGRTLPLSRAARRAMERERAEASEVAEETRIAPLSAERPGPAVTGATSAGSVGAGTAGAPARPAGPPAAASRPVPPPSIQPSAPAEDAGPVPPRRPAWMDEGDAAIPSSDTVPRVPQPDPTQVRRRSRRDRFASAPDAQPGAGDGPAPSAPPSHEDAPTLVGGLTAHAPVPPPPAGSGAVGPAPQSGPVASAGGDAWLPAGTPGSGPVAPAAADGWLPADAPASGSVAPAESDLWQPPAEQTPGAGFPPPVPSPSSFHEGHPSGSFGPVESVPFEPPMIDSLSTPPVQGFGQDAGYGADQGQPYAWADGQDFAVERPEFPSGPSDVAGGGPGFAPVSPDFADAQGATQAPPEFVAAAPDFGAAAPDFGAAAPDFAAASPDLAEPASGFAPSGFAPSQPGFAPIQQGFPGAEAFTAAAGHGGASSAPTPFPPEAQIPPVPPDESIRAHTPALFDEEDDPDLEALARSFGAPTRIVWSRPRRNQHYEAVLHPNGVIELADGGQYRHPDTAATAASGSYTADGWSVWRVGEQGPSLTEAFQQRFV